MVFGDLYLEEHRQWVERVCKELGIEASRAFMGKKHRRTHAGFYR